MAEEVIQAAPLYISDEAFDYLLIQRGKIADLGSDKAKWQEAYSQSLMADVSAMLGYLPQVADRILDVGSGLGGVDIMLSRFYLHRPEIWLLDGDDDSPVMVKHAETFNCMRTARQFLGANGVKQIVCVSPGQEVQAAPCDLIISLQSWCFHYAPAVYLEYVKACCKPGTILILDVRKRYIWWRKELADAFTEIGVAQKAEKFDRVVYRAS